MTSPTEGVVTVKAIVSNGWHLYSTSLPENGPRPTVLNFSASTGVKYLDDFKPSAKPVSKNDKMFGTTLSWWESNVSFTRRFKVTNASKAVIQGSITFMGCNNVTCLPPKTESVKVVVPAYNKK